LSLDDRLEALGDVEPITEGTHEGLAVVQRDRRADQSEQDEGRHRGEPGDGLVRDLDGRAFVDDPAHLAHEPAEQPVDDEGRRCP
jgi:hypothetical protein